MKPAPAKTQPSALGLIGSLLNRVGLGPATGGRVVAVARTDAGVYVDADTALKNDTVWACVQYLSRTVAQPPWRVMKDTAGGGVEIEAKNSVDWLLHKRPNPEMGSFSFRQTLMTHALLRGNGYAEIERDNRNVPIALWPIHPERVTPRRDANGRLEYEVWNSGGSSTVPAMDMFHIRGFGDGPVGYSIIDYAASTIGWARATEIFGATFFGQGMNPSGVIECETGLSPNAAEELRKDLKRLYSGPKGERTVILDRKMKFVKSSTNPDDSQFIESMQHQVEAICRWFGVPPHKVQHLLRATFSNIEHQSIEVVVDSIMPWVKCFEEEADYKLFGQNRQGFSTKMNLRGLMRGDNDSRAQFYKDLWSLGSLTVNDILKAEDMNPIGAEGDVRFVPMNMIPLGQAIAAGREPKPDPAPPPADKPRRGANNRRS